MYFYLYDSFVAEKKYERTIALIESRLVDIGISGKVGRMTPFTNPRNLIRDEIRCGAKTIVIVGNDETIVKVLDGVCGVNAIIGIIPIGEPNAIAASLGIPNGLEACDILSRRLIHDLDIGRINGQLFMTRVIVPRGNHTLEGEGSYRISPLATESEVTVANIMPQDGSFTANPKDGLIDARIESVEKGFMAKFRSTSNGTPSILRMKKFSITCEQPIPVIIDGVRKMTSEKISIEVLPKSMKVITGKARCFT